MRVSKTFIPAATILLVLLAGILSSCIPPALEVINVTRVEITDDNQLLIIGDTLQLTVVVTPEDTDNKTIIWESDNPDIATVDDSGLVTALSVGTANITVTTNDGAFADTIKITVIKSTPGSYLTPTPVTSVPGKYILTTTVSPAGSGTTTGDGDYAERNEVSITAIPAEGYEFDGWTASAGTITDATSTSTVFTMPAEDTTVTANFTAVYEVTFNTSRLTDLSLLNFNNMKIISRDLTPLLSYLSGVTIEIFSDKIKTNTVAVITTDEDGIATLKLPNGKYWFTASKEGYEDYPPENDFLFIPRTPQPGHFEVAGADITEPPIEVPLKKIHTVTFDKNNDNAADANPVTMKVVHGNSLANLPEPPVLNNYTFLGWATTRDTSETNFDINTIIENDITVYAVWCQETSLYSYGLENYSFVEGYQSSYQTQRSKEDNYLYLYANGNNVETGYITKDVINFSDISFIEISWGNYGADNIANASYLTLKNVKNKTTSRKDANCITVFSLDGKFNKTNRFDVRAFNDSYHIGIHARTTAWDYPSELKIYEIKLLSN